MAQFPSSGGSLKQPQSRRHLENLGASPLPLVLKKAKGVHLYDIDGNKFLDFSLQEGEVVFGHGAEACSKYAKNALSSGLSSAGGHSHAALRAQMLWERRLGKPAALFNSLLEALCTLIAHVKPPSLAYSNNYIKGLLQPLEGLIGIKKDGEFRICEPALGEEGDCSLHSRFFYRECGKFSGLNILHASPFGGKDCSLIFGDKLSLPKPVLSFENAALLGEGAKFKPLAYPKFCHPLAESFLGYALLKKEISLQKALEAGLVITKPLIFFSPLHTEHDIKRLKKFLDQSL